MNTHRRGFVIAFVGLLLLMAPMASSAQSSTALPGTITVTGEGTATAPAEEALVVIIIGTDGNAYYDPVTLEPDDAIATPMAIDTTPVVDAIVTHGISAENIEIMESPFMGEWGSDTMPSPVMILVTIPQPTVDGLSELLEVVRTSATGEELFVNQFGVMYSIADCRALRQEARVQAVANARMEAEDQATALETTVGAVVVSKDSMPMGMGSFQVNSCSFSSQMQPYNAYYAASQFDPALPIEVSVSIAVDVSYEIP